MSVVTVHRLICDFADKGTVWDVDVGPFSTDYVISWLLDLIDHLIEIVSGIRNTGLHDSVGAGAGDGHIQSTIARFPAVNLPMDQIHIHTQ